MNPKKFTIKKLVAVLAAAVLVFGGIMTALVLWYELPGSPGAGANRVPYNENFELELADGDGITLSLVGADLRVTAYDGETLTASFEGTVPAGQEEQNRLIARRNGNLVEIIQNADRRLNISMLSIGSDALRGVLSVQVPRKHISRVRAETFSGNMDIAGISADGLTASSDSGEMTLAGCGLGSLDAETFSGNAWLDGIAASGGVSVSTSSGDIEMTASGADSLSVSTFSGNIRLADAEVTNDFYADTSSGGFSARGLAARSVDAVTFSGDVALSELLTANAGVETSSGNVDLEFGQAADINCETFSGDVTLTLPADMGFDLSFDTFSGSLSGRTSSINIPDGANITVGDGAHSVDVSTSSGNLTFR